MSEFNPLHELKLEVLAELERYWQTLWDAEGDDQQKETAARQLTQVRFLPRRPYESADDIIVPSALVEIETLRAGEETGARSWCYLVPSGGGLILSVRGRPVQVLTPQSPLGAALLGKRRGEEVQVSVGQGERRVRVRTLT